MNSSEGLSSNGSFAALRQFARTRKLVERCDFCSLKLATNHQHLMEPAHRRIVCVCDACAVLFSSEGETAYRRIPRRILYLPEFRLTDVQWESLRLPIQLAFFFNSSPAGRVVALYPSPAGATESLLDFSAWEEIVESNSVLKRLAPDVEALLVNRTGRTAGARGPDKLCEYYLAPIDECFKLVGLIRANWRGLSGGTEVWKEINQFFADLKARATPGGVDEIREDARA